MFAGSQSVSIEVRIIWYQSLALKSGLPFVSCYLSIFFRFCSYSIFFVFVLCTKWKKKEKRRSDTEAPSWKKKREVILKQQILSFYLLKVTLFLNCDFSSFSSLKQKKKKRSDFFSFSSLISCFCHIFPCCWYWFKFCKLNFLIKFISFRKNWKGEALSGKRQESVRLILKKKKEKKPI